MHFVSSIGFGHKQVTFTVSTNSNIFHSWIKFLVGQTSTSRPKPVYIYNRHKFQLTHPVTKTG